MPTELEAVLNALLRDAEDEIERLKPLEEALRERLAEMADWVPLLPHTASGYKQAVKELTDFLTALSVPEVEPPDRYGETTAAEVESDTGAFQAEPASLSSVPEPEPEQIRWWEEGDYEDGTVPVEEAPSGRPVPAGESARCRAEFDYHVCDLAAGHEGMHRHLTTKGGSGFSWGSDAGRRR